MPVIGDVSRYDTEGYKGRDKIIWESCHGCGKERWVLLSKQGRPCNLCFLKINAVKHKGGKRPDISKRQTGSGNPNWKGGHTRNIKGYLYKLIEPSNPYYAMTQKQHMIAIHRLVMAEKIGRCLMPIEKVHHINGIKDDNRPENLELISQANHNIYKQMCSHCELRKEIRSLKWQIKELKLQLQNKLMLNQ